MNEEYEKVIEEPYTYQIFKMVYSNICAKKLIDDLIKNYDMYNGETIFKKIKELQIILHGKGDNSNDN